MSSPIRRVEVLQTRLDLDADRDEAPPFATTPLKLAGFGFVAVEEDEYGDVGATPLFTGLFGTLPGSTSAPLPLRSRFRDS